MRRALPRSLSSQHRGLVSAVAASLLALHVSAALAQPQAPSQGQASDAPTQAEPRERRIAEIRVEGNRRVEAAAIERALIQKRGDPFDPSKTAEDLRALWKLGYFADAQLLVQNLPQGGVAYVVRVEERPTIREVRLQGLKELSKDDFKETLDLKANSILDLEQVRKNGKKVQEKYVEKGFFLAEVTSKLEKVPETNQVDVVFVIDEHSKVQVREITFVGNSHLSASELKEVMATKEASLLSFISGEGTYREEMFQRDLAAIQAAYYDRGFVNVRVEKPVVSISPDKRDIFITLHIQEGEQYRIGKLDFSGELVVSKPELAVLMSSKEGTLFNRSLLARDIQAITEVYYDQGFAYANINPLTRVDAKSKTIDLTFDIQKGRQVSVERIEISGNSKTRDKVIRRELRLYEGELFSGSGLRRSQERVNALGFFETVEVTHRPGSADDRIVIQVEVKEKATGTFQVGLGYGGSESFIFTAQISQNNFLGWGQAASLSLQWSGLRRYGQFSYFDPYFLDSQFIFSTELYNVQADYIAFVRNSTGGNVNIGRHLWEDVMVNLTYTLEFVDVERGLRLGEQIANQFRSGTTSSVRASLSMDKRDNRLFPSKGYLLFGSIEFAPPQLLGSFLFTRYTAYARHYTPLPFGFVFKVNATVGWVNQLFADRPLPISEMYFVGGINTVRGYFLRSITPTARGGRISSPDAEIEEFSIGGDKQLILNTELEFPIFEKVGIRGVIFYDAGNAWGIDERFFEDKQDRLPLGVFHSVGFGFRWFSPIGPLRFEWGIPLNRRARIPTTGLQDQPVDFQFTIGNFF